MTVGEDALRLARRLAALPEPAMREHRLREFLRREQVGHVVQVLDQIYHRGRHGGPPFNVALLAVAAVLGSGLDYERHGRLYGEARERGLEGLSELFYSPSGEERAFPRDDEQRDETLGHRKWWARLPDRNVLERLLRNPEPEVVPNLLANPRVTEQDVVLLAARRPAFAEVQQRIFASRRWIARYPVKRALVLNPYTPTDISLRLLGLLNDADLRLVQTSTTLPEVVREAAGRLRRG